MKKHTQRKTIAVAIINKVFKEMDTDGLVVQTDCKIGDTDTYRIKFTKGDKYISVTLGHADYRFEVCQNVMGKWNSIAEDSRNYAYYVSDIARHIVNYIIRRYLETI